MMKHYSLSEIESLEKTFRANLINSVSGYKPANLIGTVNENGVTNLAIFSSVIHLGANPALLGFIQRPVGADSHTYKNIKANGFFTINHVHENFVEKAHYTSARFDVTQSEFDACQLTAEFLEGFVAPFVKESQVKIGLRFVQEIPIELNGTTLLIGQIEHLFIAENSIEVDGNIRLDKVSDVAVAGLETYYKVEKLAQFPYAKVNKLPF
jgi:flavin reductase (DIM6/NTAB) family NADH-FMN oxidoreductase RutF